jgi:hypothetical protein
MGTDSVTWQCRTTLRKFEADYDAYLNRYGASEGPARFYAENQPYEERVIEGNLLQREGILALFNLLIGAAETAFSNANSYIGVGNSATGASDTDGGLLGASKLYKGMESGYPIVGALADKKCTWRAVFGDTEANFEWAEWTVASGNSDSADNLNRKVDALGTKTGGSWQLTVEVSLA